MIGKQFAGKLRQARWSRFIVLMVGVMLGGCASTPWYDYPPPDLVPLSPQIGATLGPAPLVTFSWEAGQDVETYEFHIFNNDNKDINSHMLTGLEPAEICRADICSIDVAVSLPASTRHAWRVRARNVAGASVWTRHLFTWVPE